MPTTCSWLRRQWREAVSDWRKAPVCFSLGLLFCAGACLCIALPICCGSWALSIVHPLAERFHPDTEFVGIAYWLYLAFALGWAAVVFLSVGLWRAYRKVARDAAGRESAPPDGAAGGVRE